MKSDFTGTGPMKEFVEDSNRVFAGLMNAEVKMPAGFVGTAPTFRIVEDEGGAILELEMNDAIMLNPDAVVMFIGVSGGDGTPLAQGQYRSFVENGILTVQLVTLGAA